MSGNQGNNYKYKAVADQILEEIKNGRWKVGEKLPSETLLMNEYNVSRVTLREALKRLAALELVDIVQGDGTYVKKFDASRYMRTAFSLLSVTEKNIEDIYQTRIFVESGMAGLAASRCTDENTRRLSYLLARMEEEIAFNRYVEYSRYDEKFHKYIYEMSGNQLLIMMADMFRNVTTIYTQRLNQRAAIVERSMVDHRQIYYAIEEKNAEYAATFMRRHLEYSRDQLLKMGV